MPQLTMPNIGEGVAEGTVTRWIKQEGETVALDEPVVEVETDKAVVEIPSPFAGTLTKILVPEGGVVPIGAPLADFSGAEATDDEAIAAAPTTETIEDATPTQEPARAAATAGPAPREERRPAAVVTGRGTNGASAGAPSTARRNRQYSPVVMKLASEHGIDLALVRGTGIEGRVTRQDVLRYLENPAANTVPPPEGAGVVGAERRAAPRAPAAPTAAQPGTPAASEEPAAAPPATAEDAELEPLTATRRTIARNMAQSHVTIPVAWMVVEADVTGLVALRTGAKEHFERSEGVKLTYLPLFVQAIVGALKEHPALNATFTDDGIAVHRRQHVGVAMATERGLLVPVIRDAGDLSITGLAKQLDDLAQKARDRKLTVDEMRGATFTVDNTGAFGSIISQPIVPVGQAAIITTEAIRQELRPAGDGGFAPRSVMNLCISFDHRALDGAQAGEFMRSVRQRLEAFAPGQAVY